MCGTRDRSCQSFWEFRVLVYAGCIHLTLGEIFCFHEIRPLEVSPLEVGLLEISSPERGPPELGPLEVSPLELGPLEVSPLEVHLSEVGKVQACTTHIQAY